MSPKYVGLIAAYIIGAPMLVFGTLAVQIFGGALITLVTVDILWWYRYWAKNDANRLGTEQFVVVQQILEIGGKDPTQVAQLAASIGLTSNPAPRVITGKKGEKP